MAVEHSQSIQWRLSSGQSIFSSPMQDPDYHRGVLSGKGMLVWDTEKGVPFLEVPIEDREISLSEGKPKVAAHTKRSITARNLFAYEHAKENWVKKSANVLLVQGGGYKIASEVNTDIKIIHSVANALRPGGAHEGPVGQVVSTSVGGAITLLGLGSSTAQLVGGVGAYRKGAQKVKSAQYADETYALAQQNLDATVSAQKEMIDVARREANSSRAGRILGEDMRSGAKTGIGLSLAWGGSQVADLVGTGMNFTTSMLPAMEGASVLSSLSTGIGVANSLVCLPLDGYSLYSNLTSMDDHLATKKAAENLCKEYGVNAKDDPELELIGNMVKERQAYKGKGFTAGMSALKIFGAVVGLVSSVGGLVAATGTAAATAFAVLTPIGWTISAGATLGLIGYGLYKIGKYVHRRMEIRELNKLAAHTSPSADKYNLPELSDKQQAHLNALRQKASQVLAVELNRVPTDEEVESKVNVEIIERLIKVDSKFAAHVLFSRFSEDTHDYASRSEKTIDDLTQNDFVSAGGGAAFLAKIGSFDVEALRAIAHGDPKDPGDSISLIMNRLHL